MNNTQQKGLVVSYDLKSKDNLKMTIETDFIASDEFAAKRMQPNF
jgi:hypothetical protein